MALNSAREQRIRDRITKKETHLDRLYDALENNVTVGGGYVAQYSFSTGDGGSQQTSYRRVSDIRREIDIVESQIDRLWRKLDHTGLMNLNMRRRGGYGG